MRDESLQGCNEAATEATNEEQPKAALRDVIDGLVLAHNRTDANTGELHHTASTLTALVEILIERGLIDQDELAQRRSEIAVDLRRTYVARGMTVAVHEPGWNKYYYPEEPAIDCENRLHLCKAACCRLTFALSRQDIDEGTLRWDFRQPYMVARGECGYCVHIDHPSHRCSVYGQRPVICRGYDCRHDDRIWVDFENKLINPCIQDADWPGCAEGLPDDVERT